MSPRRRQVACPSPPAGWAHFVGEHWERTPVCYRRAFDDAFVDLARVEAVVRGAVKRIEESEANRVRVYVGDRMPERRLPWLPSRSDRDLVAWARRIRRAPDGGDFTVVVNGSESYDAELHRRAAAFLRALGAHAPLSVSNSIALYLSDARATAFGIHRDDENNFIFMVHGRKRFRIWPKGVIEAHPHLKGSQDYDEIVDEAFTFDLEPGDLLYVPHGLYHVAESRRGFCVHAAVILHESAREIVGFVAEVAQRVLAEKLAGARLTCRDDLAEYGRGAPPLPASIAEVVDAYAAIGEPLRSAVREAWAARSSAFGFADAPPTRSAALRRRDRLVFDPSSRLVVYREGASAVVAANGHAYRFPAHPRLVRVVEAIRGGREDTVAAWIAKGSGLGAIAGEKVASTPEIAFELLEALVTIGAAVVRG